MSSFRYGSNKPVSFDYFSYNKLSQFRTNYPVLKFDANTFYWVSLSVDIPKYIQANLTINDEFSLAKTNTILDVDDTLCKDELFQIENPNDNFSIISSFSTNAIYGSSFQLDILFYPLIAFHVARLHCVEQHSIVLDTVHHNIGNAWKTSNNNFVAPSDGLYYFSVNFKISAGPGYTYIIRHNRNDDCYLQQGMAHNLISKENFDFMCKSCFIKMKATDQVALWDVIGNKCTGSSNEQISLCGFNYNPKNKLQVK